MTSPSAVSREQLERLERLLKEATPGPWCAETCGEKGDGSDIIGVAFGPDDELCERPLSGWLPAFNDNDEEIEYYRDEQVAECDHRNRNSHADAALIVAVVNALPSLLSELRLLIEARGPIVVNGEPVSPLTWAGKHFENKTEDYRQVARRRGERGDTNGELQLLREAEECEVVARALRALHEGDST